MAFDFEYEPVITEIRRRAKETLGFANYTPIPESGDLPFEFRPPMALLESEALTLYDVASEPPIPGLKAVRDLVHQWPLHIWLLRKTTANTRDVMTVRADLTRLAKAMIPQSNGATERTLGGVVSLIRYTGMDWTGTGRAWPFPMEAGVGAVAGVLSVELFIVDQ